MQDSDRQVEVTTAQNEPAAGAIVAILEDAGVEAWTRPSDYIGGAVGVFGSLAMAPTTVMVRARDLAQARAILNEARAGSVDIDWSRVKTGDAGPDDDGPASAPARNARDRRPPFVRFARRLGIIFVWSQLALIALALLAAVVFNLWNWFAPEPDFQGPERPPMMIEVEQHLSIP